MSKNIFKALIVLTGLASIVSCSTLSNKSSSENDYLNSAKVNLSNHNARKALESANQAILLFPNHFDGYYLAAQSYQMLQDNTNASINYSKFYQLNKHLVNLDDYGLSYANFLCLVQVDYTRADYFYNQSFLAIPKQSTLMLANVYTSYGDCLSQQNKYDEAINSYIAAMSQQDAPIGAYLGISRIYLKEHNYATAYYYSNLYSGEVTVDLLKIKVISLSELLASDQTLKDYDKLSDRLLVYQQQLLMLTSNAIKPAQQISSEPINDKAPSSLSSSVKTYSPNKVVRSSSKVITQRNSLPDRRIKVSKAGRRYIMVERKDTLYSLAKRSNIALSSLIQINKIQNNKIEIGELLYLE